MAACVNSDAVELPEGAESATLTDVIGSFNLKHTQITINAGSQKGDNFVGRIFRVTVTGCKDDGTPNSVHLIVKCSIRTEDVRRLMPIAKFYQREYYMYHTVLPEFRQLETMKCSRGCSPVQFYPKIYAASAVHNDEFFIMDDVKVRGFEILDRKTTLDYNHCVLFMKTIARFHALSFAMKFHRPDRFAELAANCGEFFFRKIASGDLKHHVNAMAAKALTCFDNTTEAPIIAKLTAFSTDICSKMIELSAPDKNDEYAVIIHGDCWSNNILFKYNNPGDPTLPTEICLIDFQESRYVSPVWDLANFMYSSTSEATCSLHLDGLLTIYHASLGQHLADLSCNVEQLFPASALAVHVQKYFQIGIATAFIQIPLLTSDSEEIPDLEGENKSAENTMAAFNFESKNEIVYQTRMGGIVKHAILRGFI